MKKFVAGSLIALGVAAASASASPVYQVMSGRGALLLKTSFAESLEMAGIEVLEARIGYLAYAQEIANAMLKRQQATAIIAARHKIVEGAVSMVEMALDELSKNEIVDLDEERKAAMVSNLMVVLCSDKDAAPIVNAGTLNH